MKKTSLFVLLFAGICCGTRAQRITDIIVEADTAGKNISYGSLVKFKYFTINKKNKEKDVPFKKVNEDLRVEVIGATWNSKEGSIVMPYGVTDKNFASATVKFTSVNPDIVLDQQFTIKMNFKGATSLEYKGADGNNGFSGDSKGTPLLLRDGKLGGDGARGGDGATGKSMTVKCKREMDEVLKREILFLYVTVDTAKVPYVYRCLNPEEGIRLNVTGGNGGKGGDGGDGGKGKDGFVNDKGSTGPGDGGNGGNGGQGGNGGTGGRITVVAHTNCGDVLSYLRIENAGGQPGAGGKAGEGGKPGKPEAGQTEGKTGTRGNPGAQGLMGAAGPPFTLLVEEF